MKKTISILCIFVFVFYILFHPISAVNAARDGLLLWYTTILPTLLPMAVLSNILISSGYFHYITKRLYTIIHLFYPISESGIFPLFAGLLFGFPLGSHIISDLILQNELSTEEGDILLVICNQISPSFISSYIFLTTLNAKHLLLPGFLALYIPPFSYGLLKLKTQRKISLDIKKAASRSLLDFKIIDAGIMNGFEMLTKLGGYIMFFSIFASAIQRLPIHSDYIRATLIGILEITNGIHFAGELNNSLLVRFLTVMGFTAFGGICGICQTASVMKGSHLSIRHYVWMRLLFTVSTVILALLFYLCISHFTV